jgi:aminoglycoside phosphotransferase (APT) family kinase protein
MHHVRTAAGTDLVLRRYLRPDRREAISRESAMLDALSRAGLSEGASTVGAPRRVADQPDDGWLLMSLVPGRTRWVDADPGRLGRTLAQLHRMTAGVSTPFRCVSWVGLDPRVVPDWAQHPQLWRQAIELLARVPPYADRLIHRDSHPGNIMVDGTGTYRVIDFTASGMGPIGLDLARCRTNLAIAHGYPSPDQFLAAYWKDADPVAACEVRRFTD